MSGGFQHPGFQHPGFQVADAVPGLACIAAAFSAAAVSIAATIGVVTVTRPTANTAATTGSIAARVIVRRSLAGATVTAEILECENG